jgi:hypothetical protein
MAPQYIATAVTGIPDGTKANFSFQASGGTATISELKFKVDTSTLRFFRAGVGNVSAPVVSGVAYLTGLDLQIPSDGSGHIQAVYVSYPPVGPYGVASGTLSSITLTYVKYVNLANGTSATYTPSVSAPTMKLVGSKPVTVDLIDVSTSLTNGNVKLGTVKILADFKRGN